jgi:hypothetical protein
VWLIFLIREQLMINIKCIVYENQEIMPDLLEKVEMHDFKGCDPVGNVGALKMLQQNKLLVIGIGLLKHQNLLCST